MNQILITEKLYITPELRRKKKMYKFNFIFSIAIIIILCLSYAHSEYAKGQEEEIGDEVLAQVIQSQTKIVEEQEQEKEEDEDDGIWKIMIAATRNEEKTNVASSNNNGSNTSSGKKTSRTNTSTTTKRTTPTPTKSTPRTKVITASNGKRYPSLGRIQIPKINVDYTIFDEPESENQMVEWLKVSPCKFYGADPNQIGNCSIAGHNYRNKRFFSKVPNLVVGDKIKITDIGGTTVTYSVYNKYTVYPDETDCVKEEIPGKRIITLITCTNDSTQRVIIHAKEI